MGEMVRIVLPGYTDMQSPLVSIILPTYRRQLLLPRAISSVVCQTYANWELIVVDDEPSGDTCDVVAAFGDKRVRYVGHSLNKGLSAARNTGIRAALGEFIAFLDDDDEFLERKLERQVSELLARGDIGVVLSFEEIKSSRGDTSLRRIRLDGDVRKALLQEDLVRMQLLMVRRECFERVGFFDERLRHHEDYDMTLRLARAYRFYTVPEPLIRIIETPGSLSANTRNRISALQTIMQTHPEFREMRGVKGRWERRLARHFAEVGDQAEWRRHMIKAISANPLSTHNWLAFVTGLFFGPMTQLQLGKLRGRREKSRRDAV